jgi:hypothetical protein
LTYENNSLFVHDFASLLLGVCLSDVAECNQGNLAVWPSSHLLLHQYELTMSCSCAGARPLTNFCPVCVCRRCKVAPHGALDLRKLSAITGGSRSFEDLRGSSGGDGAVGSTPAADDGSLEALPHHNNVPPLPSLGEPLQLRMKTGVRLLSKE